MACCIHTKRMSTFVFAFLRNTAPVNLCLIRCIGCLLDVQVVAGLLRLRLLGDCVCHSTTDPIGIVYKRVTSGQLSIARAALCPTE